MGIVMANGFTAAHEIIRYVYIQWEVQLLRKRGVF